MGFFVAYLTQRFLRAAEAHPNNRNIFKQIYPNKGGVTVASVTLNVMGYRLASSLIGAPQHLQYSSTYSHAINSGGDDSSCVSGALAAGKHASHRDALKRFSRAYDLNRGRGARLYSVQDCI